MAYKNGNDRPPWRLLCLVWILVVLLYLNGSGVLNANFVTMLVALIALWGSQMQASAAIEQVRMELEDRRSSEEDRLLRRREAFLSCLLIDAQLLKRRVLAVQADLVAVSMGGRSCDGTELEFSLPETFGERWDELFSLGKDVPTMVRSLRLDIEEWKSQVALRLRERRELDAAIEEAHRLCVSLDGLNEIVKNGSKRLE